MKTKNSESIIFTNPVSFEADESSLVLRSGARAHSELAQEVSELGRRGSRLAKPKGAFLPGYIDDRGEDFVVVSGVKLQSRLLAANLVDANRVFPYLATSGVEIEDWAYGFSDPVLRAAAVGVVEQALVAAIGAVYERIRSEFLPGPAGSMNPGSLADWPISEQVPLFDLLGEAPARLEVRLLDSGMMSPSRTTSGIRFPTESAWENCMMCPRLNCPIRRAPHDPALSEKKLGAKKD